MPELIDREATLKKMCEACGYCERFEKAMRTTHPDFVSDKCNNYKFLAEQPTIEAETVRHGRWVYDETIGGMKHYNCTNCKEHNPGNECIADENQILWFEYCPKCGARMDGGADNG